MSILVDRDTLVNFGVHETLFAYGRSVEFPTFNTCRAHVFSKYVTEARTDLWLVFHLVRVSDTAAGHYTKVAAVASRSKAKNLQTITPQVVYDFVRNHAGRAADALMADYVETCNRRGYTMPSMLDVGRVITELQDTVMQWAQRTVQSQLLVGG